jgi:hypothetical protein
MLAKYLVAVATLTLGAGSVQAAQVTPDTGLTSPGIVRDGSLLLHKNNAAGGGLYIIGAFGAVAAFVIYHFLTVDNSGSEGLPDSN